MAEFQVVAKEIERLCKAYQDKCRTDECPLYLEDLCYAQAMSHIHKYEADNLENTVVAWAAEHPEPVYPTWGEWLEKQGVIKRVHSPRYEENGASYYTPMYEITNPIPAAIAEKLGLEPKEE